jgi:hypothetical protein
MVFCKGAPSNRAAGSGVATHSFGGGSGHVCLQVTLFTLTLARIGLARRGEAGRNGSWVPSSERVAATVKQGGADHPAAAVSQSPPLDAGGAQVAGAHGRRNASLYLVCYRLLQYPAIRSNGAACRLPLLALCPRLWPM